MVLSVQSIEANAPLASASDPTQPYIYFHFRQHVRSARRRECERAGRSAKSVSAAVSNTVAALDAFMKANLRSSADRLGRELIAPVAFDRALAAMDRLDLAAATIYRHKSEMRVQIRPMAMRIQAERHGEGESFAEMLQILMQAQELSCRDLARRAGMVEATLYSWLYRGKEPSKGTSLRDVGRLEEALAVPAGTLSRYCGIPMYSIRRSEVKYAISQSDLTRVRPHLPADFSDRPVEEQRTIVRWVLDHIIRAPRDEDDDPPDRSIYRCRFLGRDAETAKAFDDVLLGKGERTRAVEPPERLVKEIRALIAFKTKMTSPKGKRRNMRWTSPESVRAQLTGLEMFFGALITSGVPRREIGLINLLDTDHIEAFIDFMHARQGRYTSTITKVLHSIAGQVNPRTGFIAQSEELLARGRTDVPEDWNAACREAQEFAYLRATELRKPIEDARNPHAAINVVVRTPRPRDVYETIGDEIHRRMPLASANSPYARRQRARAFRDLMLFRYPMAITVRTANFANTLLRPKGEHPTPMRSLGKKREAELWFDPELRAWRHRQPKESFKNHGSSIVRDVDEVLDDIDGFYDDLEAYIAQRPVLLNGHPDPGTLFVANMAAAKTARLMPSDFTRLYKEMIRRYGIYNPWTGLGAIEGLYAHGPTGARHVMATHTFRITGGYVHAGSAIFSSEQTARRVYAVYDLKTHRAIVKRLLAEDAALRPARKT